MRTPHAPSLKARALRMLSMREHSRAELARKLAPHAGEGEDIEALLDQLVQQNWLSEERFAESLVHRKASRYGAARILAELEQHGVDGDVLQDTKAALTADETKRACALWARKFGIVPQDAEMRSKQMRYLMARGFSRRAIDAALKGPQDED